MTYSEKLKQLLQILEITQTELAQRLGVSFPTLNSWILGKSIPRTQNCSNIDALLARYTSISPDTDEIRQSKLTQLHRLQAQFPNPFDLMVSRIDIYDQYLLELTYHTNSIEGSTLSEPEVQAVLFDLVVFPNKTLVEHQEAKNHQAALAYVYSVLQQDKNTQLSAEFIMKIHSILMNGIRSDAGMYRNHAVRIAGSGEPTSNYLSIAQHMADLLSGSEKTADIVQTISAIHARFEQIHPFGDGNGRTGRLLMVFQALGAQLPPPIIRKEKKIIYYECLRQAQLHDNSVPLEVFILDAIIDSYRLLKDLS